MQDNNPLDYLIRGGNVVLPDRVIAEDIGIRGGMIVEIASSVSTSANEIIDASGMYVMAGVIDAHVHLHEPRDEPWEGFEMGSAALAAGGCTTFLDMPLNGLPPTVTLEAMNGKLNAAKAAGSYVDYALWGGLVPTNLEELEAMADAGVIGFKAFMSSPGDSEDGSFKEVDDVTLYEGMKRIAQMKKVLAIHAESEDMLAAIASKHRDHIGRTTRDFLNSRPVAVELDAVHRVLLFAERTECPLHIVHISSPQAVDMIWEAKRNGVDVTVETCPHYLLFTEEDVERLGPLAKCVPPIRGHKEKEGLWERLAEGKIDWLASDHSPCPPSMKLSSEEDYFALWDGISGAQSTLELMFDEGFLHRGIPLPLLSKLLSEAPARRFGLAGKGRLSVGADADLVLIHPHCPYILQAEDLYYRHPQSLYLGRGFRSRVILTMSRGKVVYQLGKGLSAAREGQWIKGKPGRLRRR